MPQPPDPYDLHDAALAELQQQQQKLQREQQQEQQRKTVGARPSSRPSSAPTPAPKKAKASTPAKARFGRSRAENRAEAPEGATNVFGSATGAIYELAALVLSIGWFAVKWTLMLGVKLVAGMFKAAHWVMHEVTGGD